MMFLLASLEAYTALQEVRDHGYAPCQAIELGDEEHRLFPLAVRERLGKFWAILPLGTLDLRVRRDDRPTRLGCMSHHRPLLGIYTES